MLRFREKRERGQEQKDEGVSSYLLVHLKPVSFYCKDGQAPAQVAQRGGGVSILQVFKTRLDAAVSNSI